MPVKEKPVITDESLALLTEIRDLQKQQTTLMQDAVDKLVHSAKVQRRDKIIKVVFYGFIVLFSIVSTYFFYSTIGNSLNGIGGFGN